MVCCALCNLLLVLDVGELDIDLTLTILLLTGDDIVIFLCVCRLLNGTLLQSIIDM